MTLGVACPDDLRPAIDLAEGRLRVVVEVTERAVAGDPARLLATVAQARKAGWGVALDDVGAAPASLAVLPFVRPDLIKLDMRLLQGRTTAEAAHIVNTVRAQAERTDAVVIAEGIETKHATGGGGRRRHHRPGVPVRPPGPAAVGDAPPTGGHPPPQGAGRPTPRRPGRWWPRPGSPPGHQGGAGRGPACSWSTRAWTRPSPTSCWPPSRTPTRFTAATRSRYEFLATRAAFTGALGHGMPQTPVAGVRGADLAADDPLRGEWDLIVIGPRFAAALVADDLGDDGPEDQRRYDVVVTHDRELVIRAAEPLLRRLVPEH